MGDGPLFTWKDKKRPRPYRAPRLPKPKEASLQQAIVRGILDPYLKPSWRFTHIPNGELRDKATAGKLKGMGVRRGWPDLILLAPTGIAHFLELKRSAGEVLSDDQLAFQRHCLTLGIPHRIAWNVDQAWDAFIDWNCLRVKRVGHGVDFG